MHISTHIEQAIDGDKLALEKVVIFIKDDIYYLALRMLANPEDAKDATQEIIIKIITKLSSFKFKSAFKTWVYRVATNYLITHKKIIEKDLSLTFEQYKEDLESDLQDPNELSNHAEYSIMIEELQIYCTISMLLCLSPSYRMSYILGEIFEFDHQEASYILEISKETYRQQLSRARVKITKFMSENCGMVNSSAKCSCERKLKGAIKRKRVNPFLSNFAKRNDISYLEIQQKLKETEKELKTITAQCSIYHYKCPTKLEDILSSLVDVSSS